jgi:Icc-related predicted phosphoesterase
MKNKMKIKLLSDTHHEFGSHDQNVDFINSIPNKDIDVLVLAGDIAAGDIFEKYIRLYCDKFPHVVAVAGNHDYWGFAIDDRLAAFRQLDSDIENFHFLENRRIEINGQGFAGCTLWFSDAPQITSRWIDFRMISGGCHPVFSQNTQSKEFLKNEVKSGDIVVTHHLPSKKCVHPRWEMMDGNCFFVCDMDSVILNNKPVMWFHGHTHDVRHLMIGETEIFCNPRGYPGEAVAYDLDICVDTALDSWHRKEGELQCQITKHTK